MAIQDRAAAGPAAVSLLSGGGHDDCADLRSARLHPLRPVIGLVVGGVVALLTAAARLNGLVQGWAAVGLLTVLLLALPTSRSLSRRILLAGCLLFGWVPVLWWWRLPTGDLGHAGLLLAGTAGLLAAWVTGGARPLHRLGRVIPAPRLIDLFPIAAAGATACVMSTWLQVRTGVKALTLMLPGWDFSVHTFITAMIRTHGVTTDNLPPPPDGSNWAAYEYPQGFHSVAATLIELMTSPRVGTASAETIAFVRATGVTMVAVVALVTAGLCAAPQLRRRPGLALPAVTLVTTAFLMGPGVAAVANGHVNFVLACGLVCAAAMIAWSMPRVVMPLELAALGGALVGVAHNWALLMTMAAPAALAVLFPLRRVRWRATLLAWLGGLVILLATAYGVLRAALLIAKIPSGAQMLTYAGGVVIPPLGQVLVLGFAAAATCLAAWRVRPGRATVLALAPLGGLVTLALVARQQLQAGPILQYYFWKYATAVELICLVLVVFAGSALLPRYGVLLRGSGRSPRSATPPPMTPAVGASWDSGIPAGPDDLRSAGPGRPVSGGPVPGGAVPGGPVVGGPVVGRHRRAARFGIRLRAGLVSLVAAIGLTQAFGYSAPGIDAVGKERVSQGVLKLQDWRQHGSSASLAALRLFAALDQQTRHPDAIVVYLGSTTADGLLMANANQWYQALNRNWTVTTNNLDATLMNATPSTRALAAMTTKVLTNNPRTLVVIPPQLVQDVRSNVAPELRARILTW